MPDTLLPLNDVVRALRAELLEASENVENESIRFQLGPIEVEFAVVATREAGPNGKIKFSVLGVGAEVGGSAKFSAEHTQRVKFTLTPTLVTKDGTRELIEVHRTQPPENRERVEQESTRRAPPHGE